MSYETPTPGQGGNYGPPGQPSWAGYQQAPQSSTMAIIALVAGILSIVGSCLCCGVGIVGGIAGIILGILGRKEIAESNGSKTGSGMALAGIITGGVGLAISIVVPIVFLIINGGIAYSGSQY